MVDVTTTYVVTLNDTFRLTYTDHNGVEQSRGTPKGIARDLAVRASDGLRALSELDGYADLPDDAAEVIETDFDTTVYVL